MRRIRGAQAAVGVAIWTCSGFAVAQPVGQRDSLAVRPELLLPPPNVLFASVADVEVTAAGEILEVGPNSEMAVAGLSAQHVSHWTPDGTFLRCGRYAGHRTRLPQGTSDLAWWQRC